MSTKDGFDGETTIESHKDSSENNFIMIIKYLHCITCQYLKLHSQMNSIYDMSILNNQREKNIRSDNFFLENSPVKEQHLNNIEYSFNQNINKKDSLLLNMNNRTSTLPENLPLPFGEFQIKKESYMNQYETSNEEPWLTGLDFFE